MGKYRKYTPETKVRIVLEILRGDKSLAQASRDYGIKTSLLYRWKDQFLEGAKRSFAYGQAAEQKRRADKVAELERLVGKLTMQLEIAKKASHYVKSLPPESENLVLTRLGGH